VVPTIDAEYDAERRTQQLGAGEQGGDLVRVVDHHGEPLEPRVQREDIVHLVGRQRHRVQDVVEAAVGEEGCLGERGHGDAPPLAVRGDRRRLERLDSLEVRP